MTKRGEMRWSVIQI